MKVVMQDHARDCAKYGTPGEALRLARDRNGHISLWVKWLGMPATWVDLDSVLVVDMVAAEMFGEARAMQVTSQVDELS